MDRTLTCMAALTALLLLPAAAQAQAYKWRDEKGSIVYSDKPPPSNIPPGNILQAPKLQQSAPAPAAAADAKGGKSSGPKSVAEREADYKKRQTEMQKKTKEDEEKAGQEQQRLAQCQSLKQNLAALESGQRIARTDASGERSFLSDSDRAKEIAKGQQDLVNAKCS